jgi:hypothetical protein
MLWMFLTKLIELRELTVGRVEGRWKESISKGIVESLVDNDFFESLRNRFAWKAGYSLRLRVGVSFDEVKLAHIETLVHTIEDDVQVPKLGVV